jgi:hypothetical protein
MKHKKLLVLIPVVPLVVVIIAFSYIYHTYDFKVIVSGKTIYKTDHTIGGSYLKCSGANKLLFCYSGLIGEECLNSCEGTVDRVWVNPF